VRKVKIAVSLSPEVLALVDQHAAGRSRSGCIDDELGRALRAREWARLSTDATDEENDELTEWAADSFAFTDEQLARREQTDGRRRRRRPRP
jgi:hypothetical protein